MNINNATLKNRAKANIKKDFWTAFAACVVASLATIIASALSTASSTITTMSTMMATDISFSVLLSPLSSVSFIVNLLLSGTLMVGSAVFFLNLANGVEARVENVFSQFKHHWGNTCVMGLLITIFTMLWSFLFIIPGIIASLSYFAAPYILAEHPEIKASEAIKMSKEMMNGHKKELFLLNLSFIGWFLLGIITLGIAYIYVMPYLQATMAEFFNEISGNNYEKAMQNNAMPEDNATETPEAQF